jgi:4-carboxymuconolactone decarboxylase/3-oxoadipate enol-lactonase/4-carboxymuconolactone decarboxylase
MTESRYETGLRVRREVLGDAYVDRALGSTTPLNADFQQWITDIAWGGVWARPGLDRRTRSLITLAILAATGRDDEFRLHLRAGVENNGVTSEDVTEMLFHVAVYGGVPAANHAFAMAKSVLESAAGGSNR